ncbi:MAG TPA: tetratricopeptide repeat protein [Terracidiphilus sp.]|jgi:Tfp pilus assembly protein PilF
MRALLIAACFAFAGIPCVAQNAANPAAQPPANPCAQFTHAAGLSAKGDHAAALAEWTTLAISHPNQPCIENNVGLELLHIGDPDNAIPHFEKAIALNPSSAEPHNYLGAALLADGMHAQHDRAEREFKRAIELNPKYADAQTNLGALCLDEGNPTQAEQLFRAAIVSDPQFIRAYVSLARTLAAQSQLTEADAILVKALAIDPNSREAQRLRKQIRSMMNQ